MKKSAGIKDEPAAAATAVAEPPETTDADPEEPEVTGEAEATDEAAEETKPEE